MVDQVQTDMVDQLQTDFNEFAEGPYHVFHARATEIKDFSQGIVGWLTEEAQKHSWDVCCGDAFCHPCISIRKSKRREGDMTMVKRY